MSIIELVRDIWMSNACVKFEERSLNPTKVIALTTKLCGGCVAEENIIFPETCVSREYNESAMIIIFHDAQYIVSKDLTLNNSMVILVYHRRM